MFLLAHRWLQPKAKAPNPPAAELAQVGRVTEIWKRLCDQARYYLEVCALSCMRCRSARGTVRRCTSLFLEHCIPLNLTSASRTLQLEVGASLFFFAFSTQI